MASRDVFLAIYSARRMDGHRLHDGNAAACVVEDGVIVCLRAIAEERLSGIKHGHGFALSAGYCLNAVGFRSNDSLHVGFVSSLDEPWRADACRAEVEAHLGIVPTSLRVVGHHESHAMLAFVSSAAQSALAIVVDGAGNLTPEHGWEAETYFDCRYVDGSPTIDVIGREHTSGRGYGQLFRGATKFLGFGSYHQASKVMALAGVARGQGLPGARDVCDDKIDALLDSVDPLDPRGSFGLGLRRLFPRRFDAAGRVDRSGSDFERLGRSSLTPADLDVALLVQDALERHLESVVERRLADVKLQTVCWGGGVAMNCVAIGRVASAHAEVNVTVPCAPSDEGQALGTLACLVAGKVTNLGDAFTVPFLGEPHSLHSAVVDGARLAENLLAGKVVARAVGGSEYGPRALGHRSLLAAPGLLTTDACVSRLRRVKQREDFQPFALTIRVEDADELGIPRSPYMSLAAEARHLHVPSVVQTSHDDGTLRVQTLERRWDPDLWGALTALREFGAVGVINTSLNPRGRPLVESRPQAVAMFDRHAEIDALTTGDEWLVRS